MITGVGKWNDLEIGSDITCTSYITPYKFQKSERKKMANHNHQKLSVNNI